MGTFEYICKTIWRVKNDLNSSLFDLNLFIVDDDDQDEDDIPSDVDMNDPFFKEELSTLKTAKADKSGKKKRKKEEKNNVKPNDLELLTMDSDDDKKHFDYKVEFVQDWIFRSEILKGYQKKIGNVETF